MNQKRPDKSNCEELSRLISLGLPHSVAMSVIDGGRDEAYEIAHAEERRRVYAWCKEQKTIPERLVPQWDCNPKNFYLAFDQALPSDKDPAILTLIEADLAEIVSCLAKIANRDEGPWHKEYKYKSCGIAYRWLNGYSVTPPLISIEKNEIHIKGGTHRFYLANHYGATIIPFLVYSDELSLITKMISSARRS
jgi:hypothetical protein